MRYRPLRRQKSGHWTMPGANRSTWNPLRLAYRAIRDRVLSERGLQPRDVYAFSAIGSDWNDVSEPILLPNLSGYYDAVFAACVETHGLGERCLLVSENLKVKAALGLRFPGVHFVTSDYFTDLHDQAVDCIWDVCLEPPELLAREPFASVVCYALLEHVLDPTCAMTRMASLLAPGGHLFLMTHTPSFPLHRYPRDYVRFHHDYFEDLPAYLAEKRGLLVKLMELYSRAGKLIACYRRSA